MLLLETEDYFYGDIIPSGDSSLQLLRNYSKASFVHLIWLMIFDLNYLLIIWEDLIMQHKVAQLFVL